MDVNSDVLFEDIIEVDYDVGESDNSDKENEIHVKRLKAKKAQIKKLAAHSESAIKKDKFEDLWSNLIREINELGPPTFTESEWRLKWSQQKYNKRRSLVTEKAGLSREDEPSLDTVSEPTHETRLTPILQKLVHKLDAISEKLDKTNVLLEKIAKSLDK